MTPYIQGPWRVEATESEYTGKPLWFRILDCYGNDLAEIDRPSDEDVEPYESAARLMACAPDLLFALKQVKSALDKGLLIGDPMRICNGDMAEFCILLNTISVAIMKTEADKHQEIQR